jgi:hypothetical protein
MNMLEWALNRAKESSTWAGLAGFAGAFGITDAEYQAVSAIVMAACGLVAVVLKEKGIIKD